MLVPFAETLIVQTTRYFGFFVIGSVGILLVQKICRNLLSLYKGRRQRFFEPLVAAYLGGDNDSVEVLRARRFGDRAVVLEFLIQTAENFGGELQNRLRGACEALGMVSWQLRRLKSCWWWIRAEAAYRLGLMAGPSAVGGLREALRDSSPEVRLMAARALAAIEGEAALPVILEHFADFSGWAGMEIAEIFLRIGSPSVPAILKALEETPPGGDPRRPVCVAGRQARLLAVELLGHLRDPRAARALTRLLSSPDAGLRARAAEALGRIGDPDTLEEIPPEVLPSGRQAA